MSLFVAGLQPALDDNGNPISGATWSFFDTETSTPRAVYADADLGVSLGSVVTANSVGRFEPIYLDDAYVYRAVLKDDGGATLTHGDIDPAGGGGSELIRFVQSGTGAAPATVQSKARQILSAADFTGFDATGLASSTTAIQNALNEANARGRCDVIIPNGAKTGALTIPEGAGLIGPASRAELTFEAGNYVGFTISDSDVALKNLVLYSAAKSSGADILLACGTSTIERIEISNIVSWDSYGFIADSGSGSGIHITTRVNSCQARRHRGIGVSMTRLFAFSFWNEVVIDFNGSGSANFPGFAFDLGGLGVGAGGLIMRDCDVLGSPTNASQSGFVISDTAEVWLIDTRADTCGGFGFFFDTVNKLHLVDTSAGLCNNHAYYFKDVINSDGTNVRAYGRNGLGGAAANIDGLYFDTGCSVVNISGALVRDMTGHAVNKTAAQTGPINVSGLQAVSNVGRGVKSTGTSPLLVTGSQLIGNTAGNYDLAGGSDYIQATQINSGAIANVGPGPVTG